MRQVVDSEGVVRTALKAFDGGPIVAANLLVDITVAQQGAHFLEQARRCRRLLGAVSDSRTIETLQRLALEYESKALKRGRAL